MTTLRRATTADAAELTRLRGHMHRAMGSRPTAESDALTRGAFARRLAGDDFAAYVVADADRLLSCGVGWVEEHLPSPHQLDPRRGHIASMSTDPTARRQGHARAVFAALLAWFGERGVRRIDLRATPDGQPLYEQAGFRVLSGATMSWTAPGTRTGMGQTSQTSTVPPERQ